MNPYKVFMNLKLPSLKDALKDTHVGVIWEKGFLNKMLLCYSTHSI